MPKCHIVKPYNTVGGTLWGVVNLIDVDTKAVRKFSANLSPTH